MKILKKFTKCLILIPSLCKSTISVFFIFLVILRMYINNHAHYLSETKIRCKKKRTFFLIDIVLEFLRNPHIRMGCFSHLHKCIAFLRFRLFAQFSSQNWESQHRKDIWWLQQPKKMRTSVFFRLEFKKNSQRSLREKKAEEFTYLHVVNLMIVNSKPKKGIGR